MLLLQFKLRKLRAEPDRPTGEGTEDREQQERMYPLSVVPQFTHLARVKAHHELDAAYHLMVPNGNGKEL